MCDDAGPAIGSTFVAAVTEKDLKTDKLRQTRLLDIIQEFQIEVDKSLPGMYVWFSKASLHVTVRALL